MSIVIQKGTKDPYVCKIQRALNEILKTTLVADGSFGTGTESALKIYQMQKGVTASGVYDKDTAKQLDVYIANRFLKETDFQEAAKKLNVDVNSVKAVQLVESKGSGYLIDGRPIILYERHIFKRLLDKEMSASPQLVDQLIQSLKVPVFAGQNKLAVVQDYLSKNFSDVYNSQAGGYLGNAAEYPRLEKAKKIHESFAMMSASWGLFQIMGFHYKLLKFASVQDMVESYRQSERNQLLSFCDFILSDSNLTSAIRSKNWTALAKGYNGPGYATHNPPYDVRLKVAYATASENKDVSLYVPVLA